MRSGLQVFSAMLEEDRTAICGPRYAHQPDRVASRAGTMPSEVVLCGRKVALSRPRVRTAAGEVPLPTFQTMAHTDPLDRRVVEEMLVGVATRQYARSLEPLRADVASRGTRKSAVSRRFVAKTRLQLETWQATPLDAQKTSQESEPVPISPAKTPEKRCHHTAQHQEGGGWFWHYPYVRNSPEGLCLGAGANSPKIEGACIPGAPCVDRPVGYLRDYLDMDDIDHAIDHATGRHRRRAASRRGASGDRSPAPGGGRWGYSM